MTRYRARLLEDCGRSVLSEQFFRSEAYFRAEGVTHTLLVEGRAGRLRVPLVVRAIPGTALADASSPYGYPGGLLEAPGPVAPSEVDWSEVPLASIFVRDRVGVGTCFSGGTLRALSRIVDVALPDHLRSQYRHEIGRNLRDGYRTRVFRGSTAPAEMREAFRRAYSETMVRRGAAPRYFFSQSWFDTALKGPGTYLLVTHAPDGAPASGSFAVSSDGFLHAFLGGTLDAYLDASPQKNTTWDTVALGRSLGLSLHLGAGLSPGDGLEQYKRGFANATRPFHTHEIVCDERAYRELSAGLSAGTFFPAYRGPRDRVAEPEAVRSVPGYPAAVREKAR